MTEPVDQLPFTRTGGLFEIAQRYFELQHAAPATRVRTVTGDTAWLVTRHDDVAALFGDERLGRSHPRPERAARLSDSPLLGGPIGDYDTEQDQHRRMRRLLGPAFSPRRMDTLRTRIGDLVEHLLDELPSPPADWHHAFSVPLPVLVICELLGVPCEDHIQFRRWATDLTSLTDPTRVKTSQRDLTTYIHDLLPHKRNHPRDDVICDLLAAQHDHGLTDGEVAQMAAMLLFAGHETTVIRIDLGLLLLLTHPQQLAALHSDPALTRSAIEEILRLSTLSELGGLLRYARTDIAIGDTVIPAGDAIILAAQAANRDPHTFEAHNAFDITRTPNPHLTFGHGVHYCIGASLARLELHETFGRVPRRLPELRLAAPSSALRLNTDRLTISLDELPLTW